MICFEPLVGLPFAKFGSHISQTLVQLVNRYEWTIGEVQLAGEKDVLVAVDSIGLEINFSSDDDFTVGSISSTSNLVTLMDQRLIGMNETELRNNIVFSTYSIEKDDDFINDAGDTLSWIRVEQLGCHFHLRNGVVEVVSYYGSEE